MEIFRRFTESVGRWLLTLRRVKSEKAGQAFFMKVDEDGFNAALSSGN
jgi:hypothetical protein